jgi:type VI protein secretion system component VasK
MSLRNPWLTIQILWVVFVILFGVTDVSAYAGPGPGLELFSVFASLVAWVVIAVGTVLLWPFYTLMRWIRGTAKTDVSKPTSEATPSQAETPTESPQT